MIDWSQYGHHELELSEVRELRKHTPKTWGWVDGMFQAGNDDLIALRRQCGKEYEPVTRALWREVCRGAELVMDVGSHSGLFTLDAYRAGAKLVLTVEPHPINYARMVMNLRHGGWPSFGVFFGALGDENKVEKLSVENLVFCHAAGRVGEYSGLSIPTTVMRMDTLLRAEDWPRLKVVKIDAENLTPAVLRGMGGILEHKPDLIIEAIVPGMAEILKPYGYRFWMIRETGSIEPCADLEPWNPGGNYNGTHEDCRNRFASVRDLP